jgi:hypothetical protein
MKVFISWSGDPSRELAEALHDWLPLVLHYAEPWMSDVDIDAGDRWGQSVAKELDSTNFGVICVTRENVAAPWMLFEAGALAKSLDGAKVIPLLLDVDFKDISGPLAQFQAKKTDLNGISEIVQAINQASDTTDDRNRTDQLFEALWPQLEETLSGISTAAEPAKRARPQAEVLEELVASVRTLDGRMRDLPETSNAPRRRRGPKQMMLQAESVHAAMEGPGDPISLLGLASLFKDGVPWLYELGVEAFRAASFEFPEARKLVPRFLNSAELVLRQFPLKQLEVDERAAEMLFRDASDVRR